jgi:hypothetical protein
MLSAKKIISLYREMKKYPISLMKDFLKKTIILIAFFMAFITGETAYCESKENSIKDSQKNIWLHSEMNFNAKFSDYVTGKATFVKLGHSYEAESFIDTNDWRSDDYTNRPFISLNDFYVETEKDNFSGGVGIRTFPERDGLVNALQDIEYQFFPVDAREPLKMRRIGVPGIWSKFNFNPDTYFQILLYETHWSRISPEAVPELKHKEFDRPKGDQGYSLFTSFGTRTDDSSVELGFTKGWSSWPTEEISISSNFSPNPYKLSAAYFKFRKSFDTWSLTSTALVKHCEENAGSIWNFQTAIDKQLSLWGHPASIGTSIFIVDSFVQSEHLRTSPWEDLGNSISFWAYIDDKKRKRRYGIEHVLNPEEYGVYVTGFFERWVSDLFKIKTQMDFIYDREKHISDQQDSIRISAYSIITF